MKMNEWIGAKKNIVKSHIFTTIFNFDTHVVSLTFLQEVDYNNPFSSYVDKRLHQRELRVVFNAKKLLR